MKQDKLKIGSCFSGIGGLELGLEWTGKFQTIWQIENDKYAVKVLEKWWPKVKRYKDIKRVHPDWCVGTDIIVGGYPCQPFSIAGNKRGENDERYLWPYMLRIIRHTRPKFVLLENVSNHLSVGFKKILWDLAEAGLDAEWGLLSANQFGSPQIRKRLFCLAYPKSQQNRRLCFEGLWENIGPKIGWTPEPRLGRVAHGVPNQVHRLKCLGNAVVPQISEKIGDLIYAYDELGRQK